MGDECLFRQVLPYHVNGHVGVAVRFAIPAVIIYWLSVLTGSLGFIGISWISMGSCSRSGLTLSAVGGVGSGGFRTSGVASCRPRCGGGFRGDDGCTPSLGLSVDTDFTATSGLLTLLWSEWLRNRAGALPGPSRLGFTSGWVLPVTAWLACWLRWTALIGRLPIRVHGSRGS